MVVLGLRALIKGENNHPPPSSKLRFNGLHILDRLAKYNKISVVRNKIRSIKHDLYIIHLLRMLAKF